VTAPDVVTHIYAVSGTYLRVQFFIKGALGGTPNTQLRIALPDGFVAARRVDGPIAYNIDTGTFGAGRYRIQQGEDFITLFKIDVTPWAGSTVDVFGTVDIPI